ncbi:hypothetical protein EYC84_008458 [Monilinia fructicola]|uniref:Uncharacterized protein n=1 Tax=Monilinia fructicola TaxID=38448 RepID=A0A5M9JJ80_MONFR|nr:hypothetical protein EYC84_008458 [Monilinia fructicola]
MRNLQVLLLRESKDETLHTIRTSNEAVTISQRYHDFSTASGKANAKGSSGRPMYSVKVLQQSGSSKVTWKQLTFTKQESRKFDSDDLARRRDTL